jgi:hypothetical protein
LVFLVAVGCWNDCCCCFWLVVAMALPCCIKSAASPLLQCKNDGIVNNGFALRHSSSSSSYFSSSSSSSFTSSSFFTSYCGLCKLAVSLDASSAGQRKACSVKSDSGWKPPSTVVQAVVKRSPKRLKYAGAGSRKASRFLHLVLFFLCLYF